VTHGVVSPLVEARRATTSGVSIDAIVLFHHSRIARVASTLPWYSCQSEGIAVHAVLGLQQPPGAPLVQVVDSVAGGPGRDLHGKCLEVGIRAHGEWWPCGPVGGRIPRSGPLPLARSSIRVHADAPRHAPVEADHRLQAVMVDSREMHRRMSDEPCRSIPS
jgi:hypothetical protein